MKAMLRGSGIALLMALGACQMVPTEGPSLVNNPSNEPELNCGNC